MVSDNWMYIDCVNLQRCDLQIFRLSISANCLRIYQTDVHTLGLAIFLEWVHEFIVPVDLELIDLGKFRLSISASSFWIYQTDF